MRRKSKMEQYIRPRVVLAIAMCRRIVHNKCKEHISNTKATQNITNAIGGVTNAKRERLCTSYYKEGYLKKYCPAQLKVEQNNFNFVNKF